jgi:hypothetical protein
MTIICENSAWRRASAPEYNTEYTKTSPLLQTTEFQYKKISVKEIAYVAVPTATTEKRSFIAIAVADDID